MTFEGIPVKYEAKRGCGYRSKGGLYLITEGISKPCGRLPIPLTICPCCGGGIKVSRGYTWVAGDALKERAKPCVGDRASILAEALGAIGSILPRSDAQETASIVRPYAKACERCPMSDRVKLGRCGLLWIGEKFYPTTRDWNAEAQKVGVSRRIKSVPHDFVLGETWIMVAHRKAISDNCEECQGTGAIPRNLPDPPSPEEPCEACKGKGQMFTPGVFHLFQPSAIEYVVRGDETEEELEAIRKRGITPVIVKKAQEDDGSFEGGAE